MIKTNMNKNIFVTTCISAMLFALLASAQVENPQYQKSNSVLDIFPDTGHTSTAKNSTCTFDYTPSGSKWHDGVSEENVFMASIKGEGWQLGIGKGSQIYSLRGPYGESIPPQQPHTPWNDEVWQAIVTHEETVNEIHNLAHTHPEIKGKTAPLLYFIHQSGIYVKGEKTDTSTKQAKPFYSPCLRKNWNPETKTLSMVNWIQQAHTPAVWQSHILLYSAYRDLGEGVLEVSQVLHNFGDQPVNYVNAPWGGVRKSSLPQTVLSKPDGTWFDTPELFGGWSDIPTRNLCDTGGWTAWAKDQKDPASPALALVFGVDNNSPNVKTREDNQYRWGDSNNATRDYQVSERIGKPKLHKADSVTFTWYLVSGTFEHVVAKAKTLVKDNVIRTIKYSGEGRQKVFIDEDGYVNTEGRGKLWRTLRSQPMTDHVPVFLLRDKRTSEQLVSADIYALATKTPYPNPIPKDHYEHPRYENRFVYKQYGEHIVYENLLGYAYVKPGKKNTNYFKPEGKVKVHESVNFLTGF